MSQTVSIYMVSKWVVTYKWGIPWSSTTLANCSPWILIFQRDIQVVGGLPINQWFFNQGGSDLLFQPTLRGVRGLLETYRLSCRPGEFLGGSIGIHEK